MERGPPARIVSACLGTEEEPCVRMAAHAPIIDDSNKVVCARPAIRVYRWHDRTVTSVCSTTHRSTRHRLFRYV